jgi:hypothetical protein
MTNVEGRGNSPGQGFTVGDSATGSSRQTRVPLLPPLMLLAVRPTNAREGMICKGFPCANVVRLAAIANTKLGASVAPICGDARVVEASAIWVSIG